MTDPISPLGLMQCQAEHRPQHQRRGDRQRGVARLPATAGAGLGAPRLDRLRREPHGQAAASTQAGVVLGPVRDPVALLGNAVPTGGIGLERHSGRPMQQDGFEAMLWLCKGFGLADTWTVCEQNRLLSVCLGFPEVNKA